MNSQPMKVKSSSMTLLVSASPSFFSPEGNRFLRKDLPELIGYATQKGMRAVISTNGTLITEEKARVFAQLSLSYIGVSIDGIEGVNDTFRGVEGAYEKAMTGIRNARKAGIKTGLAFHDV